MLDEAAGTEVVEPFRFTFLPWRVVRRRRGPVTAHDGTRDGATRAEKAFALARPVEAYAYGTTTPCEQPDHQVGVACSPTSGLLVIDVDDAAAFALTNTAEVLERLGLTPFTRRGDAGNRHYWVDARRVPREAWPRQGRLRGGDVKANGFVPVPGSVHPSGDTYEPVLDARGELALIELRPGDELHAALLADQAEARQRPPGGAAGAASGDEGPGYGDGNDPELFSFTGALVAAGETDREAAWRRWLDHARTLPLSDPTWAWTEADRDRFEHHWAYCVAQHAVNHPPFEVTVPTVSEVVNGEPVGPSGFAVLVTADPEPEPAVAPPPPPARGPVTLDEISFALLEEGEYRDDQVGMAELALDTFGHLLGWDPEVGRFVVFDEAAGVWRWDGGRHELTWALVDRVARRCHAVILDFLHASPAWHALRAGTADAADRARVDRIRAFYQPFRNTAGITAIVNAALPKATRLSQRDFNARPTLLSFRNGTYDVATGELREHRQADRLSQRVERDLDPSLAERPLAEVAPHFWGLLHRLCAAPGEVSEALHAERVAAVTRWLGFQLHGSNPEKKMGVFEGASDIGKNQLLEVVGEILGPELAWLAGRPTLLVKTRGDRHDAEEYQLAGTRMTLVNEMTASQILDEGQVLRFVNPEGSVVSLRRMRQDRVDVAVTWKFTSSTNELPRANLTPQVLNRLALFPLSAVPVPKTAQYDVKRAALAEGDAVLAHLVAWWRAWWLAWVEPGSATGLVITTEMARALGAYRDENKDLFAQFADDLLDVTGDAADEVRPKAAWDSFNAWFTDQHPNEDRRYGLGRNAFYRRLEELPGVTRVNRDGNGKVRLEGFSGLRLLPGAAGLLGEVAAGWSAARKSN